MNQEGVFPKTRPLVISTYSPLCCADDIRQVQPLGDSLRVLHQIVVPGRDMQPRAECAVHLHDAGIPIAQGIGIGDLPRRPQSGEVMFHSRYALPRGRWLSGNACEFSIER